MGEPETPIEKHHLHGRRREHGDAAHMPELQRALGVGCVENAFERGDVRSAISDHFRQSMVDRLQAPRQRLGNLKPYDPAIHIGAVGAVGIDDAVPGHPRTAIHSENSHLV